MQQARALFSQSTFSADSYFLFSFLPDVLLTKPKDSFKALFKAVLYSVPCVGKLNNALFFVLVLLAGAT